MVPGVPGSARASGCATTPLPAARPPATPTTHNFQGFRNDDECDVDSENEDNHLPKNVVEAERRRAAMEANLGDYCDVGAKETAGLSHMQMRALEAENREREKIRAREKGKEVTVEGKKHMRNDTATLPQLRIPSEVASEKIAAANAALHNDNEESSSNRPHTPTRIQEGNDDHVVQINVRSHEDDEEVDERDEEGGDPTTKLKRWRHQFTNFLNTSIRLNPNADHSPVKKMNGFKMREEKIVSAVVNQYREESNRKEKKREERVY